MIDLVPDADADRASEGAALLRRERTARGYSQQALATASEVSVRTVRAMESGSTVRPRTDTVVRLCRTLGVAGEARLAFLAAWGIAEERHVVPPEEMVSAPQEHRDLLAAVKERLRSVTAAFVHNIVRLDARGNIVRQDAARICVARASGVRGTSGVWIVDGPEILQHARLGHLRGCTVARDLHLDEVTQVIDFDFGRVLAEGESHYYRFSRWIEGLDTDPPEPTDDDPWHARHTEIGMHAGSRVCVLEVQFDRARRPSRCVYLLRRQLGGAYEEVRDLPVDGEGVAQLSLVEPVAAWHGIGWEW